MPRKPRLRGGDARTDAAGITDTPLNTAMFALNVAQALTGDPLAVMMVGSKVGKLIGNEIIAADEKARNDYYDRNFRARDEYQKRESAARAQQHFGKYQASREEAARRAAIIPVLLTQKDVDDTLAQTRANIEINRAKLGSYQKSYSQQMALNNLAQANARRDALTKQNQQQISAIHAQMDANTAAKEAAKRTAQQTQTAYSSAISTNRAAVQAQQTANENSIAQFRSAESTAAELTQQRQRLDQQLAAHAAQREAQRNEQLAQLRTQPSAAIQSRLPPPVRLPQR